MSGDFFSGFYVWRLCWNTLCKQFLEASIIHTFILVGSWRVYLESGELFVVIYFENNIRG